MTETVYLPVNSSSGVYHTNPDCRYVSDRHRERRQEIAIAWGYEECELCATHETETYTPDGQATNALDK